MAYVYLKYEREMAPIIESKSQDSFPITIEIYLLSIFLKEFFFNSVIYNLVIFKNSFNFEDFNKDYAILSNWKFLVK